MRVTRDGEKMPNIIGVSLGQLCVDTVGVWDSNGARAERVFTIRQFKERVDEETGVLGVLSRKNVPQGGATRAIHGTACTLCTRSLLKLFCKCCK